MTVRLSYRLRGRQYRLGRCMSHLSRENFTGRIAYNEWRVFVIVKRSLHVAAGFVQRHRRLAESRAKRQRVES